LRIPIPQPFRGDFFDSIGQNPKSSKRAILVRSALIVLQNSR
jgi:hypothetical protein